jgi:cholesterol transport system auxiliary component
MKYMSWLITLMIVSLYGCAVNTNVNKYVLNGIYKQSRWCFASCYTLFIAEPSVQPGYETDQMIYLINPYQPKAYAKNKWIAPPNEMLTSLIAQSLRNTHFFRAVVTAPFAGEAQYRLETRLLKLQQEFFCSPSQIRMVLHAVVIDNNCHQAIGERIFEAVVLAPQNNPYGGVIAANKATRLLLGQIANFVICLIRQHPSIPIPRGYFIRN